MEGCGNVIAAAAWRSRGGHLRPFDGRRAVLEERLELCAQLGRVGVLMDGDGMLHGGFQQFGIRVGAQGDRAIGVAGKARQSI